NEHAGAVARGDALEPGRSAARDEQRRGERNAAGPVRRVIRAACELVDAADRPQLDAGGDVSPGRVVEEEWLEAAEKLRAVVQDDVVGEELGARQAEQRGRERRLAAAREPGEEEGASPERDASRVQRMG